MAILFTACGSDSKSNEMENQTTEFEYGKSAVLIGTYVKSIVSQKDDAEHLGHYKIIVNDSLEVNLLPPYLAEAVRPKEEIEKFEEKKVKVMGIIVENTALSAPSLEDQPLSVDIPCFITIESIQLAKE